MISVPSPPGEVTTPPERAIAGLSPAPEWLIALTTWLRRAAASRLLVYSAFTVLYLIPTVWICRTKMLWDDEFYTLYLAQTPNLHSLLQALSTGADQHPPAFYYLTHWVLHLFGASHLVVRLPAVFGFWLFCICVYEIVRLLANPSWAVVAMLLPCATDFYYYASEARGYGLVSGFAALAVLSWLNVTANRHRKFFLPLLAFSLAAAVSSHYYAVLTAFALGMGELVRTKVKRQLDLPTWVALAFALAPIVLFLPVIRSAHQYSAHFWAVPVWSDALKFYPMELGLGLFPLFAVLAIALSFGLSLQGWTAIEPEPLRQRGPLKPWEATALCLLAALPFLAMFMAKFITHGFTDRYAISSVVGVTVLTTYVLSRLAPRSLAALAAAITCLCIFGLQVRLLQARFGAERRVYNGYESFLAHTGTQPIVISEWSVIHLLSFYAPRSIASRTFYIADADASIKQLGQDTVDRGALALRPWFPLQIVTIPSFVGSHSYFFAFGRNLEGWTWLMHDLPQWGDTTLLSANASDGRYLFYVDHLRFKPDPKLVEQQRAVEAHTLFSSMPRTGPSLCALWMGPKDCP